MPMDLEAVILWYDGYAGARDNKAACIGDDVNSNSIAGWNMHILIDDTTFQVRADSYMDSVKRNRIVDDGIFMNLDL
jgi:hypothetical protein